MTVQALDQYLNKWRWPVQQASGAGVFDTGGFQANASSTLSCCPVIAYFFREVLLPVNRCRAAVQTFLMCANLIETLQSISKGSHRAALKLELEMQEYFAEHLRVFEDSYWAFKFHMALHLPSTVARFGRLLDCWTHERKHRMVKRFVVDQRNTQSFEHTCHA